MDPNHTGIYTGQEKLQSLGKFRSRLPDVRVYNYHLLAFKPQSSDKIMHTLTI